jgi:hypothetical protein
MEKQLTNKITKRILDKIGQPDLVEKLSRLSQSDINSLFLEINKNQTDKLTPSDMLKNYQSNRFVAPSALDAEKFYQLEVDLTAVAKGHSIGSVLLSPVAPLGSCSVFGCVDQNNVISATRGCEVLPDTTNMLAIYLADKINKGAIDNKEGVHVCSANRLTRAQAFEGAGFFAHFGVFCIVSSGKDKGSYRCEAELLTKQLAFYRDLFKTNYDASISIVLRKRNGYTDTSGFFDKMLELMQTQLPDIPISTDDSSIENNYYKGINFKIYMHTSTETIEIGDGGFTDWTQKMLNSKKERCLISGIGMDRLLLL